MGGTTSINKDIRGAATADKPDINPEIWRTRQSAY